MYVSICTHIKCSVIIIISNDKQSSFVNFLFHCLKNNKVFYVQIERNVRLN